MNIVLEDTEIRVQIGFLRKDLKDMYRLCITCWNFGNPPTDGRRLVYRIESYSERHGDLRW